jgi:hypothetical protein
MIKLFSLFLLVFFTACSFSQPTDEWKYKAINAFESYKKNFLSSQDVSANSDFKRALSHAKKTSNLEHLARLYLSRCALRNSVGLADGCSEYKELSSLVDDKELSSYYNLITKELKQEDIEHLPQIYRGFASALLNKEHKKALKEMQEMEVISSKLITAELIKNSLSVADIEQLLVDASLHGYKKSVLYWLNILKDKTKDTQKSKDIEKKIRILKS